VGTVASCWLQAAGYWLLASSCKPLRVGTVASCKSQAAGYWLLATGYKLQAASSGYRAFAEIRALRQNSRSKNSRFGFKVPGFGLLTPHTLNPHP